MRYQPFAFAILASQLGCIGSIRVSSAANLRETAAILVNSSVGDVCFDKSMTKGAACDLLPQLVEAVAIQILDIQPLLVHLYFSQFHDEPKKANWTVGFLTEQSGLNSAALKI